MNEKEVPPWPLPQIHWPRSIDPEVSSRLKHTQKVGSQIDREIAFSPGAVRPPRYTPTTASSPVAARIQPQPSLQRSSSAAKPKAQDPSLPLRLLSQLEPGHSQASYINWLEEGSYFCSLLPFSYGARTQREPGAIWIRMIVPSSIAMAIDAKGSFLSFPPIASYAERCLYVQGRNHSYPPLLTWLCSGGFECYPAQITRRWSFFLMSDSDMAIDLDSKDWLGLESIGSGSTGIRIHWLVIRDS